MIALSNNRTVSRVYYQNRPVRSIWAGSKLYHYDLKPYGNKVLTHTQIERNNFSVKAHAGELTNSGYEMNVGSVLFDTENENNWRLIHLRIYAHENGNPEFMIHYEYEEKDQLLFQNKLYLNQDTIYTLEYKNSQAIIDIYYLTSPGNDDDDWWLCVNDKIITKNNNKIMNPYAGKLYFGYSDRYYTVHTEKFVSNCEYELFTIEPNGDAKNSLQIGSYRAYDDTV